MIGEVDQFLKGCCPLISTCMYDRHVSTHINTKERKKEKKERKDRRKEGRVSEEGKEKIFLRSIFFSRQNFKSYPF